MLTQIYIFNWTQLQKLFNSAFFSSGLLQRQLFLFVLSRPWQDDLCFCDIMPGSLLLHFKKKKKMQLLGFELTSKTPDHFRLFSLPTHQIQQPAQWPHASNFEAVVTPLASLLDVPPQCSKEEPENSQSRAVGSVVRSAPSQLWPRVKKDVFKLCHLNYTYVN